MTMLNLKRVNAASLYRLTPNHRPLFYDFITDHGIDYTVGFTPCDLMPGIEVYEFVITSPQRRPPSHDPKLRQTILALIYEFFRNKRSVMLCLCETGDDRQMLRSRLLESWYDSGDHRKTFAALMAEIPDEKGSMNHVALVMRTAHPQSEAIARQFNDIIGLFREQQE